MHHHHHSIHLGTAWEPPSPAAADGCVVWTRRFGLPGGLGADDRVLLVVEQPAVAAEVSVNGVRQPPLSPHAGRWAQDVTPLLRVRNELLVVVPASAGDGEADARRDGRNGRGPLPSVVGTVTLEIVASGHAARRPASDVGDA